MRRPIRNEAGMTLIEVLMAVAIMGIAVVSIVGAMGTSIIGTDHHRKEAQAHTVLLSAVDSVKSQSYKATCPASYDPSSGVTLPTGWTSSTISVQSIKYWDESASDFVVGCASGNKLQLVKVQVASPDGRATETVSVVKRDPA